MHKRDIWGFVLSAMVGVCTGLIYFAGKSSGKIDAYQDVMAQLEECVKIAEKAETTE